MLIKNLHVLQNRVNGEVNSMVRFKYCNKIPKNVQRPMFYGNKIRLNAKPAYPRDFEVAKQRRKITLPIVLITPINELLSKLTSLVNRF